MSPIPVWALWLMLGVVAAWGVLYIRLSLILTRDPPRPK